ncbi:helix-turn-helix domain-containing protein [Evansella tamaricis]|uniref:AraC family transcriptional regulator n=1 Tax=Evansella tamaricis TaxID=2069301 RepID=A0ABS6J9E1_9BACI|nr:AraC family transcriptional regulator [Evansella tamaricis]MBU9710185.1 AraC family transcriptional regulator [Evansella tamaricis]
MNYLEGIQRFGDYIEKELENEFHMNQLVEDGIRSTYISKFHFYRLFKAVVGHSVQEYVKGRILMKAAERIQNTEEDMLTIAIKYGFHSQEVFTRNFKKRFGQTPAKYRKEMQKNGKLNFEMKKLSLDSLQLKVKAFKGKVHVEETVETIENLHLVGFERESDDNQVHTIVHAMEQFLQVAPQIPNRKGNTIYRVCYDIDTKKQIPTFKELIAVEQVPVTSRNLSNQMTQKQNETAETSKSIPTPENEMNYHLPHGMIRKQIKNVKVVTYIHNGRLFQDEQGKILNTYHFIYSYRIPLLTEVLTTDYLIEQYGSGFRGPYDDNSKMTISLSIK